ncbi:hypothetical protein [Auraticoccus monumenti]|uniref:hypothetical protein n=1 Tax=Auraticoccus monumenti TaxID=675864 RepID=UPI0012F7F609|nr:hypothetical protein [Auraticoccus monumenti]
MTWVDAWFPSIVGAILGGLVAGGFAWYLLSRTERGDALDRKRATVGELLIELRNLKDLACSPNVETVASVRIYGLTNRSSVAELEMGERPVLDELNQFGRHVRHLRDWVRAAPVSVVSKLNFGEVSPERQAVVAYQAAIEQASSRLEQQLKVEVNGGKVTEQAPNFPPLPDHPLR